MADKSLLNLLLPLLKHGKALRRMSIETEYGLILEIAWDSAISLRLATTTSEVSPPKDQDSEQNPSRQPPNAPSEPEPGYRYYIWPDYQTNFVWYKHDSPRNPNGDDNVDDTDLENRYSETWCSALDAWVKQYARLFEAEKCDLGSHADPFANAGEGVEDAWLLEGMLLSCWLALQSDVDTVEYQGARKTYVVGGGRDVGLTLREFIMDMDGKVKDGSASDEKAQEG